MLGTLHPSPGGLVVDLGAGAGALTAAAAARGHRVLAVELDSSWVRALRARAERWGGVTVVHADALTVPLPRRAAVGRLRRAVRDRHAARPAAADRCPRPGPGDARAPARGRAAGSPAAFAPSCRFLDRVFAERGRTVGERLGRGAARALAAAGVPRRATPYAVEPERYAALFRALGIGAGGARR